MLQETVSSGLFYIMEQKLSIEYVNIADLKAYENNAKVHTKEQVKQIKTSIEEFGFNDPIAVWKDNEVIEGHGRLLALKELGHKVAPIIRLDSLTDEQRRAYMLVHNQLTINTGFDADLLDIELNEIFDIDMTDFGFSVAIDIDEDVEEDEYEEEDVDAVAQLGDLWQLGNHRLICGDSTDPAIVKRLLGGGKGRCCLYRPSVQRSI